MAQQEPLPDRRTLAVVAAVVVSVMIFLGWYFFLPHRVPKNTHTNLNESSSELKSEADSIFRKSQEAREHIREQEEIWKQEEAEKLSEQEAEQQVIEDSKQELEAQGFRTTAN